VHRLHFARTRERSQAAPASASANDAIAVERIVIEL
jgi:hypothetical protein